MQMSFFLSVIKNLKVNLLMLKYFIFLHLVCLLISQILTRKLQKSKNHHLVTALVTYNSGKIENPQPTYLNTPFIPPFSWTWSFWWRGEVGVEQHFDILAAILFSIMIDLIVIFLVGLLYLSSHGSHCRKTRLLWNRKKNYFYRVNCDHWLFPNHDHIYFKR